MLSLKCIGCSGEDCACCDVWLESQDRRTEEAWAHDDYELDDYYDTDNEDDLAVMDGVAFDALPRGRAEDSWYARRECSRGNHMWLLEATYPFQDLEIWECEVCGKQMVVRV